MEDGIDLTYLSVVRMNRFYVRSTVCYIALSVGLHQFENLIPSLKESGRLNLKLINGGIREVRGK